MISFFYLFIAMQTILFVIYGKRIFIVLLESLKYIYYSFDKNYQDIISLYESVKHTRKHRLISAYETFKIIVEMKWIQFVQKIYASIYVKYPHNSTIIYSYIHNNRKYLIPIKYTNGPSPIQKITDENDNDVTQVVLPFMGPSYDWHGLNFSPNFWKKKKLSFHTKTFDIFAFNEHDTITFSLSTEMRQNIFQNFNDEVKSEIQRYVEESDENELDEIDEEEHEDEEEPEEENKTPTSISEVTLNSDE